MNNLQQIRERVNNCIAFLKSNVLTNSISFNERQKHLLSKGQRNNCVDEPLLNNKDCRVELVTNNGKVYLIFEDGTIDEIGVTNAVIFPIPLTSLFKRVAESLEIASSCLSEHTKSNSPSMVLHQTASLLFCMSVEDGDCVLEEKGNYQPDIVYIRGSESVNIEITGDNTKAKFRDCADRSTRKIIVINKYKFVPLINDHLVALHNMSRLNDENNTGFLFDEAKRYADWSNKEMIYDEDLLRFFSKGKDRKGRSMAKHNKAATKALTNILKEDILFSEDKTYDNAEVMERQKISMIGMLKTEGLENEYFCTSKSSYLGSTDREDKNRSVARLAKVNSIMEVVLEDEPESKENLLFEPHDRISVHPKAFMRAGHYVDEKREITQESIKAIWELIGIYNNADVARRIYYSTRISNNTRFRQTEDKMGIELPKYSEDPSKDMCPVEIIKGEKLNDKSFEINPCKIDPQHKELIVSSSSVPRTVEGILSTSRDYFELRFRARISTAILLNYNKKRGNKFIVKHWVFRDIYAEVMIQGLVLAKDKGLVTVSFYSREGFYRTETWRLPDIENYSVGHHRLVALIVSISNKVSDANILLKANKLYGRIISENSWGLSKFLKVYRYYSTGWLVNSPLFERTGNKLIKSIDASVSSKLSVRLLVSGLNRDFEGTPFLNLSYKDIGWEIFLVNLCPSKTYGRFRHQKNVLKELYEEINLYNNNIETVKEIFDDFSEVLKSKDLDLAYEEHFRLMYNSGTKMDGRFSYSPASTVLIENIIQDTISVKTERGEYKRDRDGKRKKRSFKLFQQSVPHITELMTARASFDTIKYKNTIALEAISSLVSTYGTQSTSLLNILLLNSDQIIDIVMRMFDKDQVGGDREISILTAMFRILQSVSESFFKKIGQLTDNEFLNRKDKSDQFIERFSKANSCKHKLFNSIDQTRWGPNFNTLTFGLLSLRFSDKTTEAYLPSLICLISEFKGFEVPSWIDELYPEIDNLYSLYCKTGRSHMGQGIFHNASSVYHSFVTKKIEEIFCSISKSSIDVNVLAESSSMVTSDDVTTMTYVLDMDRALSLKKFRTEDMDHETLLKMEEEYDKSGKVFIKNMSDLYSRSYSKAVLYFGIKTNDYKNLSSIVSAEFNSEYLHNDGIGSNEIKFVYSLIDPTTTGNFLKDYRFNIDSFYSSINSGASIETGLVIAKSNYLKFSRQWKLKTEFLPMLSNETIKESMPPMIQSKEESDRLFLFKTSSNLRFVTRDLMDGQVNINTDETLKTILEQRIESMIGTRERSGFRSCITHYKGQENIVNYSKYFGDMSLIGESFESFVYHQNVDPTHYLSVIDRSKERPYNMLVRDRMTKGGKFQKVIVRTSNVSNLTEWQLVLGLSDPVDSLNSESTSDDIIKHTMRKERIGDVIEDNYKIKGLKISDQLVRIREVMDEMNLYSSECKMWIYSESENPNPYRSYEFLDPIQRDFIEYCISTFRISKYLKEGETYGQGGDFLATLVPSEEYEIMTVKPTTGVYKFIHGDRFPFRIPIISHEEVRSYVSREIVIENNRYWDKQKIKNQKVYLNAFIKSIKQSSFDAIELKNVEVTDEDRDFLGGIWDDNASESSSNCETETSEMSEIIGLDSIGLGSGTVECISLEIDKIFSIYVSGYYRKRLIANCVLNILLENNVIYSNHVSNGYLMTSLERIYIFDRDLISKIRAYSSQMSSKFSSIDNSDSWNSLVNDIIEGNDIFENNIIKYILPIYSSNFKYSISSRPSGKIVNKSTFIELINL